MSVTVNQIRFEIGSDEVRIGMENQNQKSDTIVPKSENIGTNEPKAGVTGCNGAIKNTDKSGMSVGNKIMPVNTSHSEGKNKLSLLKSSMLRIQERQRKEGQLAENPKLESSAFNLTSGPKRVSVNGGVSVVKGTANTGEDKISPVSARKDIGAKEQTKEKTQEEKDNDKSPRSVGKDGTKLSFDNVSQSSVEYKARKPRTFILQGEEKPKSFTGNNDSFIRLAIPNLPFALAIVCLLMNILLPGSGTVLSGFSILCCGKPRLQSRDDHVFVILCTNVWVGFAQLFTVTFCFVGWFWSVAWGLQMIILSVEHRRELKEKREKELQALALSAFGSPRRVRPLFPV